MINLLTGSVHDIHENSITLATHAIGFCIHVKNPTQLVLKQTVTLLIYMHWNQENGPTLYGFEHLLEKTVFLLIISCSGIGPKIAMALLAQLGAEPFLHAIQTGNENAICAVSGIGAKKAEQIIVQLKHKVAKLLESGTCIENPAIQLRHNIGQVLQSLNYSRQEISAAMNHLNTTFPEATLTFDQLMRHALSYLSKQL